MIKKSNSTSPQRQVSLKSNLIHGSLELLKDLQIDYAAHSEMVRLVTIVSHSALRLPNNQNYRLECDSDGVINLYGKTMGIIDCSIESSKFMRLTGTSKDKRGTTISFLYKNKTVNFLLHSDALPKEVKEVIVRQPVPTAHYSKETSKSCGEDGRASSYVDDGER